MKGFLQEYGIIMVVVAVVLGMLAFGKMGYAKSIQNAILGSADHIVETGENVVPKPAKASDIIEIEGTKYVVLEERGGYKALVMTANSIGSRKFQSTSRADGKMQNTYEGSEIDNYLENEWYNSLSSTMREAIQTTSFRQGVVFNFHEYETTRYNTINRHIFLPSFNEMKANLLNDTLVWTRTAHDTTDNTVETFTGIYYTYDKKVDLNGAVYPAFVIDLFKIDYKIVGHVV